MQAATGDPIDREFLCRFTGGNTALEREVLELFVEQLPIYLTQMREAGTASDWKHAAHSIKGSAMAVGAHALAAAAQSAERIDSDAQDVSQLRRQSADAVAAAAAEVRDYIACLFATA
jgi:HPt (histidine-containing phosphotransfer) domain-containing protein